MPLTIGSTGKSGSPVIKIQIAGAFPTSAIDFEATVDTGFTGFISMPIMSALPLGLPLYGTTTVQFADGKTSTRFTAFGLATLGAETEGGVVILEPSTTEVLVGMQFLSRFNKSVLMHRGMLFLIDEGDLDAIIRAGAEAAATAPQPPTSPDPSQTSTP